MLRARGGRRRRARLAFVGAGGDPRAEARASRDRRGDRRALVPDRRARRRCRTGCRARSATSCSARRSSATTGARRSTHGLLHLLGYDHGERDGAREEDAISADEPALARRPSSTRSTTRSRGSSTCSARSGTCGSTSRSRWSCSWSRSSSSVTKLELIALLLAIAFVLIAEMINTAIEGAIDVATTSFDPLAKLAKDIAAGAVLIAAINAVAVGYLVFSGKARRSGPRAARPGPRRAGGADDGRARRHGDRRDRDQGLDRPRHAAARRLPSGHAAVAFAGWIALTYVADPSHRFLISTIAFVMALLVAQTRVESGVHSSLEVASARLLGALVTLAVFQVLLVSDAELVERAEAAAERRTRRTRTTSSARSCGRATGASSGRERRERRLPARHLRREDRDRRRRRRRLPARATSRRSAITASPCGGCRQWLTSSGSSEVSYRDATASSSHDHAGRAPAGHAGTCPNEVGLRRRRRPAERRQVDARQRAHRREGRDRLAHPAHDAPPDPRRRERRRLPSSCSSTCPAGRSRSTR